MTPEHEKHAAELVKHYFTFVLVVIFILMGVCAGGLAYVAVDAARTYASP